MFKKIIILWLMTCSLQSFAQGQWVQTPYQQQKVIFDFFFDQPEKVASALYWIRSYIKTLSAHPYNQAPEFMNIIIMSHGTDIVTLAKKNYNKYQNIVERLRYYSYLGVKIKVCGISAEAYQYSIHDFYDFVEVVPSAFTDIVHWQQQGYHVIRPVIYDKNFKIEDIR